VIQQQGSTSLIQRKFAIGYNRAGRLMDQLEAAGIVGPFEKNNPTNALHRHTLILCSLLIFISKHLILAPTNTHLAPILDGPYFQMG